MVKDGRVDIAASVKDGEGAVDRLVCVTDPYTPQEGAPLEVDRAEGAGEFVDIGGSFMMPPDWNEGEVHSIEMWVENDAGLKSASKTVTVLVVEAEGGTGDIMVPVAGVDVVFGEGDDAVVVKSYERATVEIAEAPADVPAARSSPAGRRPTGACGIRAAPGSCRQTRAAPWCSSRASRPPTAAGGTSRCTSSRPTAPTSCTPPR